MELRQLEYFMTICEELHFTRASEKLGITQPTLSHQIKAIEDELGVLLFDRIGKKIAITEAGLILYRQCTNVFSLLSNAKEQIEELQKIERGSIAIGALPGELNHLVTSLLVEFHRKYPKVKIKVLGTDDLVERILQNDLDFAVTILPVDDDRLQKIHLYHEKFYFVAPSDHPLTIQPKIDFDEIKSIPIIMFPETHRCRQMIDTICQVSGFELQPLIETTTIESLFSLVHSGAGATILSKTLLEMYNEDGKLIAIPVENPSLCREVGIIYHRDKYIGKAAHGFIELIRAYVKKLKAEEEQTLCES